MTKTEQIVHELKEQRIIAKRSMERIARDPDYSYEDFDRERGIYLGIQRALRIAQKVARRDMGGNK